MSQLMSPNSLDNENSNSEAKTEAKVEKPEDVVTKDENVMNMVKNPPLSQFEIDEKQEIIFKIQKYQDSARFGNIVRNQLKFNQSYNELEAMSTEQLQNMLSRIRIHLDNKNLDGFYDGLVKSAAVAYEEVVSRFYDIYGFSDLLLEDNEPFWNSFERFKIENNLPAVNHNVQLLFMIGQATIMAHHLPPPENDKIDEPPSVEDVIRDIEENKQPLAPIPENQEIIIIDKDDTSSSKTEPTEVPTIEVGTIF